MPKRFIALLTLFLICVAVVFWLGGGNEPDAELRIGAHHYQLEVADTEQKRNQGLGGRRSLPANQGMLFVFARMAEECFWMKDMHFAIDIIWLDADKRVVRVAHDISPETYPTSFCPDRPAQYVIELAAGQARSAGIQQGSELRF